MSRSRQEHRAGYRTALRCGAWSILASLIAQVGTLPVYLWRQHELRETMELHILQGLPDEELTVIEFSPAEFEGLALHDGGREMEWRDTMFDIVEIVRAPDVVVVKAVADGEETLLKAGFDHLVRSGQGRDQQGDLTLMKLVRAWAPYCEPGIPDPLDHAPLVSVLHVVHVPINGREAGPIDPLPPRA